MRRLTLLFVCLFWINAASAQHTQANNRSQNEKLLKKAQDHYYKAEYDSSLHITTNLIKSIERKDSLYITAALIASLSLDKLNQPDTLGLLMSAKDEAYKTNNLPLILKSEYAIGKRDFNNGFYPEALKSFLKVDSIATTENIINETTIKSLIKRSEISRLSFNQEAINFAHKIMLEALEKAQKIKNKSLEHEIYMYLSDLSRLTGKLENTKKYADLAMAYFKTKNDVLKIDRIYHIYSIYYNTKEEFDNSEAITKERISYLKTQDFKKQLASAYISMGDFYRKYREDFTQALDCYQKSENLLKKIDDDESYRYQNLLTSMAYTYAEIDDFENAYQYMYESYWAKIDFLKKQNRDKAQALETKYQTSEKEKEIKLLFQQKQLAESQKKRQRNLYLGLIFLGIITVVFLVYAYRNKIKTANKLKDLDTAKSRFFANISHEFRTPLTLIKSPVQHLQEEISESSSQTKKLKLIEHNADRMLNLVDQLLELSKLDSGQLKLVFQQTHINSFLKNIVDPFEYQAKDKSIRLNTVYPKEDMWCWTDKDMLHKLIGNLFSNALKYTAKNQSIEFISKCDSKTLDIEISNSGVDITKAEAHKIFDRFYQHNDEKGGVGIGLAFVKELITHIEGKITSNVVDQTLTIKLSIPVDAERLQKVGIISESKSSQNQISTDLVDDDINLHEDDQILMLVDDNASVREVLKDLFSDKFKIIEADNGQDAFELANKHVPDLIISDVMMPKLNGYQLTKKIKNQTVTSTIPIILLTAKSGDDARLSGIESEADAYLTKPFNHKILIAKVNQILKERSKLQEHYSQELILKPTGLTINSVNEEFIKHLENVLEDNISNAHFNTEDFATEMAMSRMQLHRKLKTLFGVSATEFIRNERLKAAAELLKQKDLTISEIAYQVGFNDVGYFSKCFKTIYNCNPSEYQKNQK